MKGVHFALLMSNLNSFPIVEKRMVFNREMNTVHIRNLDLNLLIIAEVIYRHRNLTVAAAELHLTPSAVSHALRRLADYYGAPLFVRAARGVVPTALGLRLEPEILGFRTATQRALARQSGFDPARAEGRIYIAATEYFELVVGHPLLSVLKKEAPRLQLCFLDARGQSYNHALETGGVDLTVGGFFRELPEGLSRRQLFSDQFATLAGGKLPHKRPLSLKEYVQAAHLFITLTGDFEGRVDAALQALGQRRQVVAATTSFATPAWLLGKEDLVLTAPRMLLDRYGELVGRKPQPCPLELPGIDLQMIWHQRTQKEPLHQWLRDRIAKLCRSLAKNAEAD